jgi:bifunctional non-homologous end joining protein LigD
VALDKYRAKRNFNESPEPAGDAAHASPTGRTPRFFCVQKHLASHLHYDFRLEHDGVLLSWAVPKGPSLDPATKRLAMHVEDHPIEYGDFEGVIPSGYGAGIVMLWDRGTWTPESDDVDAALKKGDLKITLDGYKLKGSWVLVRTKGWGGGSGGGGRSWLLIKHRDEWAGEVDITEFAPLSVKSRGDFADILAQDDPAIWHSHRPAQGGEAGAMFAKIVARALEMREGRGSAGTDAPVTPKKAAGAKVRGVATKKTGVNPRTAKTAPAKRTAAKSAAAKNSAGRATKKAPAKKAAGAAGKVRPRTS